MRSAWTHSVALILTLPLTMLAQSSQPQAKSARDAEAPTSTDARPDINAEDYDPFTVLPRDLREELDTLTTDELLKTLSRYQNSLSRKGQGYLRIRAQLNRLQSEAQRIVSSLEDDAAVERIENLFKNEQVVQEIASLTELDEDKLEAGFNEFRERHQLSIEDIRKVGELRTAKRVEKRCAKGLKGIEGELNKDTDPKELGQTTATSSRGLLARLEELEEVISTTGGQDNAPKTDKPVKQSDLKAMLQALLPSEDAARVEPE